MVASAAVLMRNSLRSTDMRLTSKCPRNAPQLTADSLGNGTAAPMLKAILWVVVLALMPASFVAFGQDDSGAEAYRVGELQIVHTMTEVAGAESAAIVASVVPPDEPLTWEVFVPKTYNPEAPAGLMVYISPSPSGRMPSGWKSALASRNIIWIGANGSGNDVVVGRRVASALVGPTLAAKYYNIDPERTYITGFSGGSRVASRVAVGYPQVFRGAIYGGGVDLWEDRVMRQLDAIRQNHFVFMAGNEDFALPQTKKVHKRYVKLGIERSDLVVIPNKGHQTADGLDFARALDFLDSRLNQEGRAE
jgi:hypothetical protein